MIRFLDSFGFVWHVAELPAGGLADAPGLLYFFSRGTTLRLRAYPADWESLGWRELDSLRLMAEVLSSDVTRPRAARALSMAHEAMA